MLAPLQEQVKFPRVIWADAAYQATVSWAWVQWPWCVELVHLIHPGFQLLLKPWIVGRTFG